MPAPRPPLLPPKPIRTVALCLFRQGDRILVEEHDDTVWSDRFCRPVGGGIEYGERSDVALIREIREELGEEIEDLRLVCIVENLFVCEGVPGHEIDFIYDARFADQTLQDRDVLSGYEIGNDTHFTLRWQSLAEMEEAGLRLVPNELRAVLADFPAEP